MKLGAQIGHRFQGHLFTTWTLQPESSCGNKREETDESRKEGMTPLIPSSLLRHPPGGKFNKVHIPRAIQERQRDENTWKERWRETKMEKVGWGDRRVAVRTDASPTVSPMTFRIAGDHRTSGGRMKRRCRTQTQKKKNKTMLTPKQSTDGGAFFSPTHIYFNRTSVLGEWNTGQFHKWNLEKNMPVIQQRMGPNQKGTRVKGCETM